MKRSKVLVAISVFMVVAACCGSALAKEHLIRYNASKGEQTKYKMNMHGETTIYVEDQTQSNAHRQRDDAHTESHRIRQTEKHDNLSDSY